MTDGEDAGARWWEVPPARQVSYLAGVDPEMLAIALDPLPDSAPAVVQFRPGVDGSLGDQISLLLDELDHVALALFPRWLPGAEHIEGPQGLGIPAVRALATQAAATSTHFGPFLADLAEHGLRGRTGAAVDRRAGERPRFPADVRAAGLARVLADAYGRESTALLIEIPQGLGSTAERALTAAAEWLAQHGHITVWLTGAPLRAVDRIRVVAVTLPEYVTQLLAETWPADGGTVMARATEVAPTRPVLTLPALSGSPRKDSPAEQALERALTPHEWANGRRWNHTFQWHILGKPYRLDLFWPTDGLVVEVDGPEHRGRLQYADDRRRDVQLQLLGHDVLRFTNEQVLSDVQAAVLRINQLLSQRRAKHKHHVEMRQHVDH